MCDADIKNMMMIMKIMMMVVHAPSYKFHSVYVVSFQIDIFTLFVLCFFAAGFGCMMLWTSERK